MINIKYNIYPSLLDAYQRYLDSNSIYNKFWGFSDNPEFSEDEFSEQCEIDFMNKINRVPIPWEKTENMDSGTASSNRTTRN